jgi:hypothetical protein
VLAFIVCGPDGHEPSKAAPLRSFYIKFVENCHRY